MRRINHGILYWGCLNIEWAAELGCVVCTLTIWASCNWSPQLMLKCKDVSLWMWCFLCILWIESLWESNHIPSQSETERELCSIINNITGTISLHFEVLLITEICGIWWLWSLSLAFLRFPVISICHVGKRNQVTPRRNREAERSTAAKLHFFTAEWVTRGEFPSEVPPQHPESSEWDVLFP